MEAVVTLVYVNPLNIAKRGLRNDLDKKELSKKIILGILRKLFPDLPPLELHLQRLGQSETAASKRISEEPALKHESGGD